MLLCFLVFCLPTMNGIVLAYFTKQLQRDVGITIAQYGLLTGVQQISEGCSIQCCLQLWRC